MARFRCSVLLPNGSLERAAPSQSRPHCNAHLPSFSLFASQKPNAQRSDGPARPDWARPRFVALLVRYHCGAFWLLRFLLEALDRRALKERRVPSTACSFPSGTLALASQDSVFLSLIHDDHDCLHPTRGAGILHIHHCHLAAITQFLSRLDQLGGSIHCQLLHSVFASPPSKVRDARGVISHPPSLIGWSGCHRRCYGSRQVDPRLTNLHPNTRVLRPAWTCSSAVAQRALFWPTGTLGLGRPWTLGITKGTLADPGRHSAYLAPPRTPRQPASAATSAVCIHPEPVGQCPGYLSPLGPRASIAKPTPNLYVPLGDTPAVCLSVRKTHLTYLSVSRSRNTQCRFDEIASDHDVDSHYCDFHGPTPLMVTEGLPVPCSTCCEDGLRAADFERPRPRAPTSGESAHTANITEALRRISFTGPQRSSSMPATEQEAQVSRASLRHAAAAATAAVTAAASGSAIETPPQSPRPSQGNGSQQAKQRQDLGFRKTYDDYVTRRAGPCDNCALTLPRRQESKDTGPDARLDRGPTLRTRAPCARVFTGLDVHASPPTSQSSSSVPSEDESSQRPRPSHRRTGTTFSITSRSSGSSGSANASAAASATAHTHYLDYTSTREPLAPASFSLVRASCLRTLSLETLPRAPATCPPSAGPAMPTPNGSPISPAYVTTHSIGSAASGGSIFFGDKKVGYTTAYIFRVPDVHARGHKRVYAFLALSTHPEPVAVKPFTFLSSAFREMAAWIQELAEVEAERALAESTGSAASSPVVPGPGYGSFQSEPTAPPVSGGSSSSFLMGGVGGLSRRMGGGFGGSAVALKQRGLAELVGLPDFFIELHAKFVRLLLEMGVMVGS